MAEQSRPFRTIRQGAHSHIMSLAISVIVPTYNRADFVSETVRSILDQSLQSIEVLVIDDGSTDHTREALQEFAAYGNFHYRFKENEGRSIARNMGIEMAKGDYMMFLDSDDILEPDALATLFAAALENPDSGVVGGGWGYIDTAGATIHPPVAVEYFRERYSEMVGIDMIQDFYVCIGSYIIKSDLARSLNGFDPSTELAEDYDLFIRFCGCTPVTFLNKPIVRIRRHGGNTSTDVQFHSFAEVCRKNIEMLRVNADTKRNTSARKMLAMWYFRLGDDFYNSGKTKKALHNYLLAVASSPRLIAARRRRRVLRQILFSTVPSSFRRALKN